MTTNQYTVFLGDPEKNPELKCYCPADGCLKAGAIDLYKCVGAPVVLSHAHFYSSDKSYLQMVDGLKPSKVR